LDEDGLEAVHNAAMRIVEEIGIDFLHEDARRVLKEAGCEVQPDSPTIPKVSPLLMEKLTPLTALTTCLLRPNALFEANSTSRSWTVSRAWPITGLYPLAIPTSHLMRWPNL
jgi:hypothetical protein